MDKQNKPSEKQLIQFLHYLGKGTQNMLENAGQGKAGGRGKGGLEIGQTKEPFLFHPFYIWSGLAVVFCDLSM